MSLENIMCVSIRHSSNELKREVSIISIRFLYLYSHITYIYDIYSTN